MITFDQVSVHYPDAAAPALTGLDLTVPEGELCLLVGPSGAGKSTLLGTVNGLVPHFTGGVLHGRVTVAGRDTRDHRPRELADLVGTVGQDPGAHFVTDTVEDELAYGMESLGLAPAVMRRRVEETLDLLGLAELRDRPLATLSGGQRQRVAIGSVLTVHPKVLVLDEPTSALDPGAAEEVLAVVQRLVHDLGTTVLMAEHRLERVVQYADQVLLLPGDGGPAVLGEPAEVLAHSPVHPPVVGLGRLAGWSPLPLSVRDARRRAAPLRARLAGADPAAGRPRGDAAGAPVAETARLTVQRGPVPALREVSLTLRRTEITALMGRNGAGKSTLLGALAGLHAPTGGSVRIGPLTPHRARPKELVRQVGLVPQDPRDLLCTATVAAECAAADQDADAAPGSCRALLERLLPGLADDTHPRDLSEGQRLTLALAVVLTARPALLLLDEPTRGLDYAAKARLVTILGALAAEGHAILLATHDVELAAELAHRTLVLAEGELVADGPAAEVVLASPVYAPQVAKVLAPEPWLTVRQVAAALREAPGAPERAADR
ncbi:ABC transporter ATP-binding protein [Kitasatospora sp. NBC_01302]|uniref:ABC transporter ATP-binding protein n=1 Tax=Kitasatospora sp. NBC_01302 TaxID=2903575 RepID=UPI002E14515A|nr:ATP-binding cassette domain-containing protein [Kitasatospora sp. NBC_01302]